jgi:hypothetical protein
MRFLQLNFEALVFKTNRKIWRTIYNYKIAFYTEEIKSSLLNRECC